MVSRVKFELPRRRRVVPEPPRAKVTTARAASPKQPPPAGYTERDRPGERWFRAERPR